MKAPNRIMHSRGPLSAHSTPEELALRPRFPLNLADTSRIINHEAGTYRHAVLQLHAARHLGTAAIGIPEVAFAQVDHGNIGFASEAERAEVKPPDSASRCNGRAAD